VAHFAWAHTASLDDRANPLVLTYTIERTERGLRAEYSSIVSNTLAASEHMPPQATTLADT
jgi:vanillate O-demethylase monooxygenase subunit